jgi:hypothetical protein
LPCDVTGIEDFQWEEFFVLGPGNRADYKKLQQNRPSYRDIFELTSITLDSESEWCMVPDELKAHVHRKTDGKRFVLGLSELKATDKDSQNYQMLHDYTVWLVNYRQLYRRERLTRRCRPTSGAHRFRLITTWLSRRSRLSAKTVMPMTREPALEVECRQGIGYDDAIDCGF